MRKYESAEVELKRREIFIDNLNHIREHNDKYQKGEKTYYLGVNKFADKVHVYMHIQYYKGKILKLLQTHNVWKKALTILLLVKITLFEYESYIYSVRIP